MRSDNAFIVAAAGGGKTTRIVGRALGEPRERCALVTYTLHNVDEIKRKVYELAGAIPPQVEIWSWYSFLLHELARPYQRVLHAPRIDQLHFVQSRSARWAKRNDIRQFYFANTNALYSDKAACFACEAIDKSGGAVISRLEQRFDRLYIDEVQDLAGYDLDLVERLLRSRVKITLVGDHRQATLRTNNSARNKAYSGSHIVDKFREWRSAGLGELVFQQETHRCNQAIASFADSLFLNDPPTVSSNNALTGHDGVFIIPAALVESYVQRFAPQVLRLNKTTDCRSFPALNFGQAKGRTYDRVLIFPHGKAKTWLKTGDLAHIQPSCEKFYVGLTRARYSVAIAFDGIVKVSGAQHYEALD